MVVFSNLSLTSNCSQNLKRSLEAWSFVSHLLVIMPAGFCSVYTWSGCLRTDFYQCPQFPFIHSAESLFKQGIVGGKSCREDLPCSLGDNNC